VCKQCTWQNCLDSPYQLLELVTSLNQPSLHCPSALHNHAASIASPASKHVCLPTCTVASDALSRKQTHSALGLTADHSRQGSTNPPQHHPQHPRMHEFRKVPASSKLYTGISGEARAQARERLFKINPYPCWLTGKPETITCIQISYQHKSH